MVEVEVAKFGTMRTADHQEQSPSMTRTRTFFSILDDGVSGRDSKRVR